MHALWPGHAQTETGAVWSTPQFIECARDCTGLELTFPHMEPSGTVTGWVLVRELLTLHGCGYVAMPMSGAGVTCPRNPQGPHTRLSCMCFPRMQRASAHGLRPWLPRCQIPGLLALQGVRGCACAPCFLRMFVQALAGLGVMCMPPAGHTPPPLLVQVFPCHFPSLL